MWPQILTKLFVHFMCSKYGTTRSKFGKV